MRGGRRPEGSRPASTLPDGLSLDETGVAVESGDTGERPGWLDEAAEVYSHFVVPGRIKPEVTLDMGDARDALEAAGIPCYLELLSETEERISLLEVTHRWRLLVPGNLGLRAASILERDIFNQDFEAEWRAHLEMLSDEELSAMNPQVAFCGLFDRVERLTKAYDEEITRRRFRVSPLSA